MGPAVSLLMANHNGSRHLAEAIASAQQQTLADWELILVDDASTDDSLAIAVALAQADRRIKVLAQARNRGPAAARNRALAAARGAWVAVVDSDDVMLPTRLERLLARAEAHGAEMVADNQLICGPDLGSGTPLIGKAKAARLARVDLKTFIDSSRLYSRLPDLGFLKPLIRRDLIARAGARYDEGLRIGEDFHFLVALLAAGAQLHLEPEPYYLYRKHRASISHRLKPEVLAAMIAADQHARDGLGDPAAVWAMTRRIEGQKSWAVHEQVMAEAKAGRWLKAMRIAAARPHAWALISRPLRRRLGEAVRGRGRTPGPLLTFRPRKEPDMSARAHPGVVCVIIAARNARSTVARAVGSALAEAAVGEVVVIDDGSTDDTAAVARSADDGSDRLQVLHLPRNLGPAAARNRGIRASSAPFVTVLDADDYWLPGRLQALLAEMKDHDFVADDLLRVVEGREDEPPTTLTGGEIHLPTDLTLAQFAIANVSRKGRNRQELGFLKPLMRRTFLQEHHLTYDESLKLGEDYVLYAQALARGARFRLIPASGYVAVERAESISGSHGVEELAPYAMASQKLVEEPGLSPKERAALAAHARQVRSKLHFQRVLAVRRRSGLASALGVMIADPFGAGYVLAHALGARLARLRERGSIVEVAY